MHHAFSQARMSCTTRAGWPSTSEPSPAGAGEGERPVVEAEEVQERGVVVVVGDDVLDGLVAELVGRAVDVAALEAAAGQPHAEAVGVVVAADVLLVLDDRQPAHLAAPVDQVVSSSPRCFRSRTRAAEGRSTLRHIVGQRLDDPAVVVPVLVAGADLDEPHAALDQPAGDQAAGAVLAGRRVVEAVQPPGRGGSRAEMSSASLAAVCIRAASS